MATYYAHTPIRYGSEVEPESGAITKAIVKDIGEEVSQKDLGISDEAWERLIANGSVRDYPYPDVAPGESPATYYKRLAREVAEAAERGEPVAAVEPKPKASTKASSSAKKAADEPKDDDGTTAS